MPALKTTVLKVLRDERGMALPIALMVLAVLGSLTAALAMLGTTEPLSSTNLKRADQALTLAEAGVERSIWTLSPAPTGPVTYGVATPLAGPQGAPWDGSSLFSLTASNDPVAVGGYTVQLMPGARPNEVQVASTGWIPNNANPSATRAVRVTLMSLNHRFRPPGALNVDGETLVSGNAAIAAYGNICNGSGPASGSYSSNATEVDGAAQICAGVDCSSNQTDCQSPSCLESQPNAPTTFNDLTLTRDELNMLKDMAKQAGTYWGPPNYNGPSTGGTWNGAVNFGTSVPLPNGIVFVDTISGNPPTASNVADMADVRIAGSGGTYSGWMIVMGSIDLSGDATYNGLVYAADDLTAGNGTAVVNGAVIAHNENGANDTQIDTTTNGTISINYDCNNINNAGGRIPQGFMVKPGTWREVSS